MIYQLKEKKYKHKRNIYFKRIIRSNLQEKKSMEREIERIGQGRGMRVTKRRRGR